ncbi:kielin/chordin-like protein [Haliotis rufescens]|uniref:kielin/chordin-like protein n=1 Tax=Haliotis rufescens TaxID=6454 RepID=UPI001EAFF8A0|nr:kielin/chordin-like protein [Haliotis rufescens]
MLTLIVVAVVCVGGVAGGCPFRDGNVEEGFTITSGCLTCTCGSDDMYICSYPECNFTETANPCLRYSSGCCAECLEYGCYNQYFRGDSSLVPLGLVPHPTDPCVTCTCNLGHGEVICRSVMCERPKCANFRRRPGFCCEYDCPDDINYDTGAP